ncbi:uncharacterized protein K452DRAFT_313043 [Aplosporella prunicola CBS 121167]|uniref:Uncharacterized protein n=1 Tax=Aplosporella prunicola CBS 121167 TaxID=1176127 RepID=A0A6A6AZB4_9PEZI|nr:uncharacterized protein K452DRAFT_313043 [Aplosporella prunicola CBS 121167]KAF2136608.1 hypothetical protein K452DRAFT_313043 [Aplosporella prunicola CBS 121167]
MRLPRILWPRDLASQNLRRTLSCHQRLHTIARQPRLSIPQPYLRTKCALEPTITGNHNPTLTRHTHASAYNVARHYNISDKSGVATLGEMDDPQSYWRLWCSENNMHGFIMYRTVYSTSDTEWEEVKAAVLRLSEPHIGASQRAFVNDDSISEFWLQWVEERPALKGKGVDFVREHFAMLAGVTPDMNRSPDRLPDYFVWGAALMVDEASLVSIQRAIKDASLTYEVFVWAVDPTYGQCDGEDCPYYEDGCQCDEKDEYLGYHKVRIMELFGEGFFALNHGVISEMSRYSDFFDENPKSKTQFS